MFKLIRADSRNSAALGSTLVLLSSIFYGTYGIWTRLMGDSFGSYAQAGLRCIVVMILLSIFGKPKTWRTVAWSRDWPKFLGLLFVSSTSSPLIYYATNRIGIGLSTLLFYAGILLSMFVFGWLLNGERYDKVKLVATILAIFGLYLVFKPSVARFTVVPLLGALLGGAVAGFGLIIQQRLAYESAQTAFLAWSTGAVTCIPIAIMLHNSIPQHINDIHWLYLLIFAFAAFLASWSVTHGLKKIEAGVAGIIGLMEVVFGFVFGITFFHERPAVLAYIGALCVIAAAAIPYIKSISEKGDHGPAG